MTSMATAASGRTYAVRGQDAAVALVRGLVAGAVPHAILLVGPPSSGKTTLALDLAAALLCSAGRPADRPCRDCRGCRLVAAGNHPDLHRLAPEGAGRQIVIGDARDPEPGTIRRLVTDLALLPVEGGHRIAIVESAGRMNEDAQNALLKTLEEPPARVTIVLCADDEERLLPTVRSRCARIRLGPVGSRAIEGFLEEIGAADPPTAARLARLAGGRPGLALALARAPEAVIARGEIARSLLDALGAPVPARLALVRELAGRAAEIERALEAAMASAPVAPAATVAGRGRGSKRAAPAAPPATEAAALAGEDGSDGGAVEIAAGTGPSEGAAEDGASPGKVAPAERRRAALALIAIWRGLARDLAVAVRGGRASGADPALLDELEPAAATIDGPALVAFLARAERTARQIEGNANPELALDLLVLAWPRIGSRR